MSAEITRKHPELFHYTTAIGLEGIVRSRSLWATHYQYVNDNTEFSLFFSSKLTEILNTCVPEALAKVYAESPDRKKEIEDEAGSLAEYTKQFIEQIVKGSTEAARDKVSPYLLSLCGAATPEIAKDGLLSQWRGYGSDGGYAIVFDTATLVNFLCIENSQYHLLLMEFCEVEYSSAPKAAYRLPRMMKLEEELKSNLIKYIETEDKKYLKEIVIPTITLAYSHKHHGFREENEIRVVCIPMTKEIIEGAKPHIAASKKIIDVCFRSRDGLLVPYVTLFKALPIKRIIVGPHPDKEKRVKSVQMLLDKYQLQAEVYPSEIPYIGK